MRTLLFSLMSVVALGDGYQDYIKQLKEESARHLPREVHIHTEPESFLESSHEAEKPVMSSAEFSSWLHRVYDDVATKRKETLQYLRDHNSLNEQGEDGLEYTRRRTKRKGKK